MTTGPATEVAIGEPGVDVCRLVLAFVGLTVSVGIPGVLLAWLASDLVEGLGRRMLEIWP